jgi:hypothetical protein
LPIVRWDAEAAYGDLDDFRITIARQANGWRIPPGTNGEIHRDAPRGRGTKPSAPIQRPCYTDRRRSSQQRVRRQKGLLLPMAEALRLSSLALFAIGPVVAALALLRRGIEPSPLRSRIRSWRWYVPAVLLPAEWLLPPILIALRVGAIEVGWLPVRVVGLAVGLAGAVLLTWSAVLLSPVHDA